MKLTCKQLDDIVLRSTHLWYGRYDAVVGISRDGLLPATKISHAIGVPFHSAHADRATGKVHIAPKLKTRKVLIVDDVVRTGGTLSLLKKHLPEAETLAVFASPENWYLADYCLLVSAEWVWPEWEEPAFPKFKVGFDLDGVICPDIFVPKPLDRYALAWRLRRRNAPLLFRPPEDALIVTGRPECDAVYTRAWLRKHGVMNRIEFNRGEFGLVNSVKTKEVAIRNHQIEVFYESDPRQVEALNNLFVNGVAKQWRGGL